MSKEDAIADSVSGAQATETERGMTTETIRKAVARAICKSRTCEGVNCCEWPANMGRRHDCPMMRGGYDDAGDAAIAAHLTALKEAGFVVVPIEPTEAMLNGARDWSLRKNGQGVGNDQATGCWKAMIAKRPSQG